MPIVQWYFTDVAGCRSPVQAKKVLFRLILFLLHECGRWLAIAPLTRLSSGSKEIAMSKGKEKRRERERAEKELRGGEGEGKGQSSYRPVHTRLSACRPQPAKWAELLLLFRQRQVHTKGEDCIYSTHKKKRENKCYKRCTKTGITKTIWAV